MQSHPPRPISAHRLKRFVLWAMLLLTWIAALFSGAKPARRHLQQRGDIQLGMLTIVVRNLVLLHACARAPAPKRRAKHDKRRAYPRGYLRACAGAALRRAIRARDPLQHVQRLLAALRNLDALARGIARRLARGLTRLAPLLPVADNEMLRALFAPPADAADSS